MLRRMERATDSSLIQLRCQRREHKVRDEGASPVFLHAGEWAYCEAGKHATEHQFLPTGGLTRHRVEAKRTAGHPVRVS
jgi:hypothetical protein